MLVCFVEIRHVVSLSWIRGTISSFGGKMEKEKETKTGNKNRKTEKIPAAYSGYG